MLDDLLYGVAYYPEYIPYERMDEDMSLMRRAGFNLIRVAESTWSTWEPRDGEFDLSLLRRTLDAADSHGLKVIVGTPTYAIPAWLYKKYPDILTETHSGVARYGGRQNFDITHPGYRFHAERIMRRVLELARQYECVIGYQIDNETKHYDTCSPRAQAMFREYLERKFGTVEELNRRMGLAYWSNSIADWSDLPDVRGTINGSLGAEYSAFQRGLVTDFLLWQRSIIDEYRFYDQFITHNFDYEWRGWSFGLQPDVDQFEAARAVTIAGCDIYHKGAGELTGAEISFGGAVARGLKNDNYLVLETQAQGNFGYLPYPGQLFLQAMAHYSYGAECVEYWHWHSIHNAVESYWKGVLSHDLTPGETYRECSEIGGTLARISDHLAGLKKNNSVAVMVSRRAQCGERWFPAAMMGETPPRNYSDYLRWVTDSLYRLNVEYDIVPDTLRDFSKYKLLVLPCLYSATEELTAALRDHVANGGHIVATFRTAFADEYLKIYHDAAPHGLTDVFGVTYDRFTKPQGVSLRSESIPLPEGSAAQDWMELLRPAGARTLIEYDHPVWGGIPAVTVNDFERGSAMYIASYIGDGALDALFESALPGFGIPLPDQRWPIVLSRAVNFYGRAVTFIFNYQNSPASLPSPESGLSLLEDANVRAGDELTLPPWGVAIIEGQ